MPRLCVYNSSPAAIESMPAWRMKPGVGSSGSPTQNGSTSGLARPSFTSSRILEAVSALTAARAINVVSNFTGYFRLPGDESSSYRLGARLRFAVHGPFLGAGPRAAPGVHDRDSGREHAGGRRGRGHRRGDRVDRQAVLGRAVASPRAQEAPGGPRLRARRSVEA